MRLFFALWPPPAAAEALHGWAKRACRATGGRAVRAASIHLTLAFLGDIEAGRLPELRELRVAGSAHALPIGEAHYWARNRIVWVGPKETPQPLRELEGALRAELAQRNFKTEERPFAAHVTLIRKAREGGDLPALPAVDWPVRECLLVRSHLSAQGSGYEILARFALA